MINVQSLPVLMPSIPGQKWSCHSCGDCCRVLVGHLFEEDRRRIDTQDWSNLGAKPYVRAGREWALNKTPDGTCVFLDENNRCRIHARYGEAAKPLACRIFPFSVRPVRQGWQVSFRFDCPSAAASKGQPISHHRRWLSDLVQNLKHSGRRRDDVAQLQRGVQATPQEIDMLIHRFEHWLKRDDLSLTMGDRLIGISRINSTLFNARFKKVRGERFSQLLDLLFKSLPAEAKLPVEPPTEKMLGMLRQLIFAHAEYISFNELISGGIVRRAAKRWRQLSMAKRFKKGTGRVPCLPGFAGNVGFSAVQAVQPAAESTNNQNEIAAIQQLVERYLLARLSGRSCFGRGYYGWPVFAGLGALCLSVAVAGWLARYVAATQSRSVITLDDVAKAIGFVDRAATRLPVLGATSERLRVRYLMDHDATARLIYAYAFTD